MSLENELAYERDIRELSEENARLTQRVEELERAPRCCADTIPPGCRTCRCAEAAEAKLAKVVGDLNYAFDQHGCFCGHDDNADWTYGKKWVHHACCPVGVALDLAAAKGE